MRFPVDAQLPPALARWLTEAGFDAEHVGDCGMQGAPDSAIWDRAMRNQAAIVTKDEDFARRRAMMRLAKATGTGTRLRIGFAPAGGTGKAEQVSEALVA